MIKNKITPEMEFTKERPRAFFDRTLNALGAKAGHKLLDVGCGRGELLHYAEERGLEVMGIEPQASFRKFAKDNYGLNIAQGWDGISATDRFDIITLMSSIQYMKDCNSQIKNSYSALKKDGIIYIETTNSDCLALRVIRLFKDERSPYQLERFDKERVKGLLALSGFRIRSLKVKGMTGGGRIKNPVANILFKFLIFAGGLIGMGHLIYCIARKE